MGEENLDYKFSSVNLDNSDGYASELNGVQGLGEGAIDVADYNNDGHPDLLIVVMVMVMKQHFYTMETLQIHLL